MCIEVNIKYDIDQNTINIIITVNILLNEGTVILVLKIYSITFILSLLLYT